MGDSEKPFACTSPGCNMSFTNEDHLVVHKKKHDMVLNLGSNGKNTYVADQTPTPTRFIRNCEEVGLFQDLQNVNPFEETFRRAVEDGKTVALSESDSLNIDDSLHTPHIFPNIDESPADVPEVEKNSASDESALEEAKRLDVIVEPRKIVQVASERTINEETDTFVAPKIIESAGTSQNISVNGQDVQLLLKTADGKLMQLSVLPICENRSVKIDELPNDVKKISPNSSNNRLTLAKMRLKQTLTKSQTARNIASSTGSPEEPERPKGRNRSEEKDCSAPDQGKKQDVLARNRASSMRARAKRKAWIQQLQRAASTANERNAALQLEVKALKFEVAKLRASLLAHQNCSVTKAMEKGSLVGVEAKDTSVVRTSQNVTGQQQNSSVRRGKLANSSEIPIAPKIQKLMTNHHAILPKIEATKREFLVRDSSMVKIVDVRSFPRDSEVAKRIIFVDNSPKKFELFKASSRQIIQVNPTSLLMENAASKCTGT